MIGKYKTFDRDEYEKADRKSKVFAKKLLEQCYPGYTVNIEDDNRYGLDATLKMYHRVVGLEVEIKYVWKEHWPVAWETVDFPERRLKEYPIETMFLLINGPMTEAWFVHQRSFTEDRLKCKPNSKVSEGEYFVCVPLEECRILKMEDDQYG